MLIPLLPPIPEVAQHMSGRRCRRCGQRIPPKDEFGLSEGVCRPCRGR